MSSHSDVDEYVRALLDEIDLKKDFVGRPQVDAIFVGRGSPSILHPHQIELLGKAISRNFDLGALKEFSFEVEVKSATPEKLRTMRHIGVNRISFGAQTFSEEYRRLLNLDASTKQIIDTAAIANSLFPYSNVDLLYGMAGQEIDQLNEDLTAALDLQSTDHRRLPTKQPFVVASDASRISECSLGLLASCHSNQVSDAHQSLFRKARACADKRI